MADHKPSLRTQVVILLTFLAVVLPAIGLAGIGYVRFVEHGLKLDINARPEGIIDRLLILLMVLPMIPAMLVAILVTGIPWMFVMARVLPWADVEYYTKQKGPRLPFLSDWLDGLWRRMIESRRKKSPTGPRQ
jgi:hypothetical protein